MGTVITVVLVIIDTIVSTTIVKEAKEKTQNDIETMFGQIVTSNGEKNTMVPITEKISATKTAE